MSCNMRQWVYILLLGLALVGFAACAEEVRDDRGQNNGAWDIGQDRPDTSHDTGLDANPVPDTSFGSDDTGVQTDAATFDDVVQAPDAVEPQDCRSVRPCAEGFCERSTGQCVECLETAHCAADERCAQSLCVSRVGCVNSLNCVAVTGLPICSPTLNECVECELATDCDGIADCIDHVCSPYLPCTNSLDCVSEGQICDSSRSRCVDCVFDADCAGGQRCAGYQCETIITCTSDRDCTPHGLLCDRSIGECRRCVRHSDCPAAFHCAAGDCAPDVCSPGETRCEANGLSTCTEAGDGFGAPRDCGSNAVCVEANGTATCRERICTPGRFCAGSVVVECSENGLERQRITDCAQNGQRCTAGDCEPLRCVPGSRFCDGNNLLVCDSTGYETRTLEICGSDQICEDSGDQPGCRCAPCEGPNATPCSGTTPVCFDGCCAQCSSDIHCPNTQICQNNVCVVRPADDLIRVELTWVVAAVPTPVNGRGTDLDLHYRHPLGRWNEAPYSIFWRYRLANWGTQLEPSIAELMSDDVWGLNPEVVRHTNPQNGLSYSIGVYYYNDNNFGPAEATVRVYVNEQLRYTKTRTLTATGEFWHVASIAWPQATFVEHDIVTPGFPIANPGP
jgi:hypothetical protein